MADVVPLAPVPGEQRIEALDVVRGFALFGIFLMNVEWFNRPVSEFELIGRPFDWPGRLDYAAGWLVQTFVQGKFWMLFSLLFGMGFAVMLDRAGAGREFLGPYLRRIAVLALFGVGHYFFLWGGDILLTYAMGAAGLLLVLHGKPWWLLAALLACAGLGAGAGIGIFGDAAGVLGGVLVLALFLRTDAGLLLAGRRWHLLALLCWLAALVMLGVAVAQPEGWTETAPFAVLLALTGALVQRYRQPEHLRGLRAGAWVFLAPNLVAVLMGLLLLWQPQWRPAPTDGQRAEWVERHAADLGQVEREAQVMSSGRYAETVAFRAGAFYEHHLRRNLGGMGALLLFLIGMWFVRSGAMRNPREHRALLRRLALLLPPALLLSIASSAVFAGWTPGFDSQPRRELALSMLAVANLPACLGYAAVIVLMLHSRAWRSTVAWLAPAGRMALTLYLAQSLLAGLFFYGYGLGQWGMGRAAQLAFVALAFAAQVGFSHWWLGRFRYGPLEWLWRSATYRRWQPLRLATG